MDKKEALHRSPKKTHTGKNKKDAAPITYLNKSKPWNIHLCKTISCFLRLTSFHKCQVLSFCTCCCAVATSPSNSRAPQRGLKLRRRSCLPTTKKTGAAILNLFGNLAFLGYLQVRALHLGEVCLKKKKSCNLQDRKPGLKKKKSTWL